MHDKVGLGNLAGLLLKLGGGYISSIILNLCIINLPLYIKGRVGQVVRSWSISLIFLSCRQFICAATMLIMKYVNGHLFGTQASKRVFSTTTWFSDPRKMYFMGRCHWGSCDNKLAIKSISYSSFTGLQICTFYFQLQPASR